MSFSTCTISTKTYFRKHVFVRDDFLSGKGEMSYSLPRRSPDLNVLDYAIWSEVEKQMRRQERKMKDSKHETRAQFEARLDRTAHALPKEFIDRSIKNLAVRAKRLYKARGGLFEEGGRRKRPR